MANTFNAATLLWTVTETGALSAATPTATSKQFKRPTIRKIVFMPGTKSDDLIFQDGDSVDAINLKAGATDTSPIHVDFGERGKRVTGLKCSTRDGGTAYVYLM